MRAVLTGEDVKRWSAPFVVGVKQPMEHWSLAVDRVRYVGEPIAVVVAESRAQAEDAVDQIRGEYETLPAVVTIEQAIAAGAPILHEPVGSNVVSDRSFRYGDPEAAFAAAARRVKLTVRYPRNSCTPIEGYVVVADHLSGDEGYEVLANFMGPFSLHAVMALALKVSGTRLRLKIPRHSGGSFGVKQGVFPYIVALCRDGCSYAFAELALRHGDFAIAACAAMASREEIRFAVGGVADRPTVARWPRLTGTELDVALNDFAWQLEAQDDQHATAKYRRHLVRRLGRRTIEEACA